MAKEVKFTKPTEEAVEPVAEVEVKPSKEFALVQVPTGQALAFQTPEGDVLSSEELLVRIANDVAVIRKGFSG